MGRQVNLDAIIKAGSVVAAIAGIGGIYTYLDQTYAKEEKVSALDQRLQQKIVGDRQSQLQQRLWGLQDRYGQNCEKGDRTILEQCRAIIQQMQENQEELERLRKP